MALRMLEFTLPQAEEARVMEALEPHALLHLWTWEAGAELRGFRILLDARSVEPLSDDLLGRFGDRSDFRMVLLPVEATVPRIEEPEEDESAEATEPSPGQGLRISREELYEDLVQASQLTPVYVVMVALSTVVAAVGLMRGDLAIIIGAMVIAPLLGPNVALSLACTLGDLDLALRSLKANVVGVSIVAALATLTGALLTFDPTVPELAARTRVEIGDVALALAAGAAGSLAFTSGVPAALVGVMVAVALLPPLVVAGLHAGAGLGGPMMGALLLTTTNVACVNLAAVATFLAQKIHPRTWWEAERARRATRIAVTTWAIMLAVLLGMMLFDYLGVV